MQLLATLTKYLNRFWSSMLRGSRLPAYLGILATCFVYWMHTTDQPLVKSLLERLDYVVYDLRFTVAHNSVRSNENNIVIVDYDQRSLQAEGQWPWSRFKIGQMVRKLKDDGAIVIGFDVFFPEYERNLVKELGLRARNGADASAAADAVLQHLESLSISNPDLFDGDAYLADSMQSTEVVLGFSFKNNEATQAGVLPQPVFAVSDRDNNEIELPEMQGYVGNVDTLQSGAEGAGFIDTVPDADGVIRSTPLILKYQQKIYPSLALDMARRFNLEDRFEPVIEAANDGTFRELSGIKMGDTFLPTDKRGRVRVPYIGASRSFPYISATDVLRDTLSDQQRQLLKSSLVLVGTTATGLYDLRATPVEAVYPGVEVHANILNAILSSAPRTTIDENTQQKTGTLGELMAVLDKAKLTPFPTRPYWDKGTIGIIIIVIGLCLSLVYPHLGPALLALSGSTFIAGLVVLNLYLWNNYNLDISLVILLLLVVVIAAVNMTYGFLKEGQHRKVIKGMFDQYVPPAHIDAMLNDPDKYNFSGESKQLSVLFSDIRNFTAISEKLKATELKSLLNEFFTPITGIIFEHSGTIDKYVGDMVMAFWGAPLDDPRHRENSVMAALAMLRKVEELKPLFKAQGLPDVNIGIGINSGMMNVGDMGSTFRRAYTVIGDAVNLGSRLEGITKNYGVQLLIGEQTHDGLANILCRLVDKVQVKGKDVPIRIYQPLCKQSEASAQLLALVEAWHAAYQLYLHQQWDAAVTAFAQLRQQDPDTYLYTLYLGRIASLRTQQLPPDWDGTYRHTSK